MRHWLKFIPWTPIMATKKAQAAWDRTADNALPEERALLEELRKARPDFGPLKISRRDGPNFGDFHTVVTLGCKRLGCFVMDVKWIREEIKRCKEDARKARREQRQRGRQQALLDLGAGI